MKKGKYEPVISDVFGNGSGTIKNLNISIIKTTVDSFFCTSHEFNEELFMKWHKNNKLNSCYVITNPPEFVSEINKAIHRFVYQWRNKNISYTPEEIDYRDYCPSLDPAFRKNNEYIWRKENRTIWLAKRTFNSLKPWIIHVPEARKHCRNYAHIKIGKINYHNT